MADKFDVRLNAVERMIAQVAPRWGVGRLMARASMANLQRAYDGASRGRGTENWRAGGNSADAEILSSGPILRARMRDLVRNNPTAANAVQVLVSSLIGAGIRPRANTGDAALNKRCDDVWARFADTADFYGHTDVYGLQSLAARETVEGGEVLALRRFERRGAKGRVPLSIEIKEADHLDDAKLQGAGSGRVIAQGIEYGEDGRRSAYWMFPDHPGDQLRNLQRSLTSQRIPADQVAHMFERQRTQNRGVPWGSSAIRALRDFDEWHEAERVRKKTEACLVAFVMGGDSDTASLAPVITRSDGTKVEQFEPGMIAYGKDATGVEFNEPSAAGGVYEWSRVQWHVIAQGFRVPYALLTTDLSQTNFSSSRVGLNEFRRMIDMLQWQMIIPMLCQPMWNWCMQAAFVNGDIQTDQIGVEWAPPAFESVNPLQDAQADLLSTRAGFSTLPQQIARRGFDPMKQIAEQAAFNKLADELNLIFDSDPRKITSAGQMQASPPEDGAGAAK